MSFKVSTTSLIAAAALILAACGQAAGPASPSAGLGSQAAASRAATAGTSGTQVSVPARSGQTTKLTMSYSNVVLDDVPLWVAYEAGSFRDNGIDVDLRLVESSTGIAALTSSEIQVASLGGSEAMSAAAGGARLAILAVITPVYPYIFEAARSVNTLDDLRGKKVGVSKIGSSSDIATRVGLGQVGLNPDKDVVIVQVGSAAARTAAIANGAIQGALVEPPDNLELEKRGLHPLFDLAALKLPAVNTCVVTTQPYLDAHRDVAQKVIDAVVAGIAREKADKAFAVDVMKKYFKSDDTEGLSAAYDFHVKEIVPSLPYPRPENFAASKDLLSKIDPKLTTFDVTRIIDSSLVESAAQRGLGGHS